MVRSRSVPLIERVLQKHDNKTPDNTGDDVVLARTARPTVDSPVLQRSDAVGVAHLIATSSQNESNRIPPRHLGWLEVTLGETVLPDQSWTNSRHVQHRRSFGNSSGQA